MEENQNRRRVIRGPRDDPSLSDEQLIAHRLAWFAAYTAQKRVVAERGTSPYTCPCCGHPTLDARGDYEICDECGWEDDGQDDHDSGVVRGGPNRRLSLDAARAQYEADGGVRGAHRPPPLPE
jgi:hypothetical protein